jgi:hypothetical protein
MTRMILAAGLVAAAIAACGGPDVPMHNGYKSPKARPWHNPTVLQLDDSLEAEVDDAVSYPKRQRARWYAVDLASPGKLDVTLTLQLLSDDRDVDLAFEVMDEGYHIVAKADRDDDDAGEEQKQRTVDRLSPGRYYIHVYCQRRLDQGDFTLELAYHLDQKVNPSNFPASVAFVGALPDVPLKDDSPAPVATPHHCHGSHCHKHVAHHEEVDHQPPPRSIRARIAGILAGAHGTEIRIDRGSNQGVAVGWKGEVVKRDGSAIPGGAFSITRVSQVESFATVRAAQAAVTAAKYVRLRPQ